MSRPADRRHAGRHPAGSRPVGRPPVGRLAAVLAVLGFHAAHAAPPLSADPAGGCRFVIPSDMADGGAGPQNATWLGACPGGLAEGSGVLRLNTGGRAVRMFAGLMHEGLPVRGLTDRGADSTGDYGPAWSFDGARPLPATTPEQFADGFKTASEGAAAASARFAEQGNAASARFYAEWSAALAKAPGQAE